VVDLCPVGALLDKDFLFKQRVWLLKSTPSISPVDSQGQAIWVDHNVEGLHRIRPRFNEKVNTWWISDEARFGWRYVHSPKRLKQPRLRGPQGLVPARWEELPRILTDHLQSASSGSDGAAVGVVLSPMMSCEEAWLLARLVRAAAPRATLALGHVPVVGEDQTFDGNFVIKAEKCPNRRGIETLLAHFGGPTASFREFLGQAVEGTFKLAYVVGGYPADWVSDDVGAALLKVEYLIVHDLFPSALDAHAQMQVPAASWVERAGTFMNADGLIQPFERALPPLEGVKADGQFFYELAGEPGLFRARKVREQMALELPAFAEVFVPRPEPKHAH
jgi:NADH-quinone oxidoreductase subunit G